MSKVQKRIKYLKLNRKNFILPKIRSFVCKFRFNKNFKIKSGVNDIGISLWRNNKTTKCDFLSTLTFQFVWINFELVIIIVDGEVLNHIISLLAFMIYLVQKSCMEAEHLKILQYTRIIQRSNYHIGSIC